MRLASVLLIILLSACAPLSRAPELNPADFRLHTDRAVVLVSLSVSDDFIPAPGGPTKFVMDFYRYDLEQQRAIGGCLERRIAILSEVPASPGTRGLFAFDAQPGAYVVSPFLTTNLERDTALIAPPGRATYFGHYELRSRSDQGNVVTRVDAPDSPGIAPPEGVTVAEQLAVTEPHAFLCTP